MSYPTAYTRQYGFQDYQTANPSRPLPGDKVDVEFNLLESTLGDLVDFVSAVTRADGELANGIVTLDSLAQEVLDVLGIEGGGGGGLVSLTEDVSGDLPFANLTQGDALSVLGVAGNATADFASIAAGSDHQVLRRSGTALAFGAVDLTAAAAISGILGTTNGGTGNGFTKFSGPTTTEKTFTLPDSSQALAALDLEGQTLTGGAGVTPKDLGTKSSGTLTPVPSDRAMQYYINDGAHTLAPGAVSGAYMLDIENSASAGAITTSGWTKKSGDNFTTTNGHKFRCHCSIGHAGSLLVVQALQ